MIKCARCQHEELEGALFCSECGAQLVSLDASAFRTAAMNPTDFIPFPGQPADRLVEHPARARSDREIRVHLMVQDHARKRIDLEGKKEYSLGRIAEGQLILPDIDLSDYDAYSQGVSRLHASIKMLGSTVVVTDLASSNGTRVNGQKIGKYVDYPLSDGDTLALGKLQLKVVVEEKS